MSEDRVECEFRNAVDAGFARAVVDGDVLRIVHRGGSETDVPLAEVNRVWATLCVATKYNPRRYRLELVTTNGARYPFVVEEGDDHAAYLRDAVAYVKLFEAIHVRVPEANPNVEFWTGERNGWWVWLVIVLFGLMILTLMVGVSIGMSQGKGILVGIGFLVGGPLFGWYFLKILWLMAMPRRYEPSSLPGFLLPSP